MMRWTGSHCCPALTQGNKDRRGRAQWGSACFPEPWQPHHPLLLGLTEFGELFILTPTPDPGHPQATPAVLVKFFPGWKCFCWTSAIASPY